MMPEDKGYCGDTKRGLARAPAPQPHLNRVVQPCRNVTYLEPVRPRSGVPALGKAYEVHIDGANGVHSRSAWVVDPPPHR